VSEGKGQIQGRSLRVLLLGSKRAWKTQALICDKDFVVLNLEVYGGALRRLSCLLRTLKYFLLGCDIYLTDVTHYGLFFLSIAKCVRKKPLVVRLRGNIWKENESRWFWRTFDSRFFKSVDAFIVVSNYLRLEAVANGIPPKKIFVVNTPIVLAPNKDTTYFDREKNSILIVTNFHFFGKVSVLASSVRFIVGDRQNIQVNIVGSGQYLEKCKSDLDRDVRCGVVKFWGSVRSDELSKLYQRARLCVHISQLDAYPSVIQEAMSHGLPVVAMNIGGVGEMIENESSGYVCNSNCDIRDACYRILENERLGHELSKKGKEIAKEKWCTGKLRTEFSRFLSNIVSTNE
jgi:glycosyltransferase involved in cell wall biosynthesis